MSAEDHAILIGINHYPELGEGCTAANLRGPANDVDAIKAWLLDPKGGGFPDATNIHVIKSDDRTSAADAHPTADELELVLAKLDNIARSNKQGLRVGRRIYLFMSGHGFSPEPQHGCLFAANAKDRLSLNVHATGWLSWLQDSGYFREFVLWMDCCMNRMSFLRPRDPPLPLVNAAESPRAIFVAFAAKRNFKAVEVPIAEDGDKLHGVFTWTLIEGLRGAAADANGRVTGHSLADWIRNAQVARMLQQDIDDPDVAKEPEVIREDATLIFTRGVAKPFHNVCVSFPTAALGGTARLWCGAPPRAVKSFPVTDAPEVLSLQPGLYLIDVASAGLRHGFEVVKPAEILVDESGPAVNDAPPGTVFQFEVDPGDPTAEIFIIDSQFSLTDSDSGRLSTPLPFGLFKVKMRIGRATNQRIILIDRDRPPVDRAAIVQRPATVVPIFGTAASHEYHAAGMAETFEKVRKLEGAGSRATLMVMVRAFSSSGSPTKGTRPWEGVSIVDSQGETVQVLERGEIRDNGDPFAFCVKAVTPGSYFLRQRLADGNTIEQSLVVCEGWGHEVYVLRRVGPGETTLRPRPRVSIMMRRIGEEAPTDFENQLIETARIALADERRILNPELETLLLEKFKNPMAGIIGGHLLLVERERDSGRDLSPLDTVVRNLHSLVGTSHPDVATLALQCADPKLRRTVKTLVGPPMFQRSWKLLSEAAQKRPSLVPTEMWERIQALTAVPPFLAWATDESVKSAAKRDLVRAILSEAEAPPAATTGARAFDLGPRRGAQTSVISSATALSRTLLRDTKARLLRMNLPPIALEVLKSKIK
jgi:hypothetical protein